MNKKQHISTWEKIIKLESYCLFLRFLSSERKFAEKELRKKRKELKKIIRGKK